MRTVSSQVPLKPTSNTLRNKQKNVIWRYELIDIFTLENVTSIELFYNK